jgi:hypothetical protein
LIAPALLLRCSPPPSSKRPRQSQKSKGKQGGGLFFGDPLERELAAVGLRVAKITADGNCLFRAVGDQTEVCAVFSAQA